MISFKLTTVLLIPYPYLETIYTVYLYFRGTTCTATFFQKQNVQQNHPLASCTCITTERSTQSLLRIQGESSRLSSFRKPMPPQSSNLKQKLSALSLAQSAPSSPNTNYGRSNRGGGNNNGTDAYANNNTNGAHMSATAKRKTFLHAPSWMMMKKPNGLGGGTHQHKGEHVHGDEEMRLVQEVLEQMIFQAGVDYEYVLPVPSFLSNFGNKFLLGRGQCKRKLRTN